MKQMKRDTNNLLSIMGGIQNLIIYVKMAWSEHLDCGVNIR